MPPSLGTGTVIPLFPGAGESWEGLLGKSLAWEETCSLHVLACVCVCTCMPMYAPLCFVEYMEPLLLGDSYIEIKECPEQRYMGWHDV